MKKIDVYIVQKVINVLDKYNRRRKKNELSAWDKNVLNADKFVYQLSNSLKIILHKDSLLSKLIFEGFEHDEELFISRFIKQGDIFFDVGANIGMHTLFAAHTLNGTGKVYAFEPTPATVKRLRENVALNKLVDCVNIEPVGLSNQAGELNLNLAANGYDAWNSFANLKHIEVKDSIIVPVVTLDEFIESYSIEISHISLIKIDVEGWEIKVFEGMRRLFDNNLFKATFLIEFTEENMFRAGYSCKELYNYLVDKGYKWYEFDPQSNSIKFSELKAYYPYQNLIATKNPEAVNARLKEAKKDGA